MKIKEILDRVDRLKPNNIDEPDKVGWISELDGIIHNEIFSRAADYTEEFTPYVHGAHEDITMLVPFPYTDIYYYYLSAKIDAINGEYASYNNNMALYNSQYEIFAAYYRRNHMPK